MWKVTQHKVGNGQQEIQVSIMVKDMAANSYATYAGEFKELFATRIKEIRRTNNFEAWFRYKVIPQTDKILEVWKVKINDDLNYKMFTLEYEK